ncbi:SpoIIAA family protein [Aporhodopirellula rubra]|uniref:STAS/SEC14 domain-containing protein n=1 Tax=Aporhodopirellula rubra TaxID=980271 RepID=UPI0021BCD69A|nr:STAS/SEC14 domain-containing protein [Aporhodopirellula rubra]
MKFVREHHKKLSRIALATDSSNGSFAESIGSHFVNVAIKTFEFSEQERARSWILDIENS